MASSESQNKELDELLALVEDGRGQESAELNEAERFVISAGIKEGDVPVQAIIVWFRYKQWAKKPITRWKFYTQFKKLFRSHYKQHQSARYYYLDPAPFDLSQDAYWIIRREERESREKKVKSKKPGKVPRTRS